MAKLKLAFLIILAVVLVDFAWENAQPAPMLKLFKYSLTEIPAYLLAYSSLALGLAIGWVAHGLRIRRKRRVIQAAQAASTQQRQEAQEGHAETQAH